MSDSKATSQANLNTTDEQKAAALAEATAAKQAKIDAKAAKDTAMKEKLAAQAKERDDKAAAKKAEKEAADKVKADAKAAADKAKADAKATKDAAAKAAAETAAANVTPAAPKEKGKVEQILDLHRAGKTNKEIVALGFNPTTTSIAVSRYKREVKAATAVEVIESGTEETPATGK